MRQGTLFRRQQEGAEITTTCLPLLTQISLLGSEAAARSCGRVRRRFEVGWEESKPLELSSFLISSWLAENNYYYHGQPATSIGSIGFARRFWVNSRSKFRQRSLSPPLSRFSPVLLSSFDTLS